MPLYRPDFPQFSRRLGQAPLIPVYRELLADGLTPVSAFARISEGGAPSFLFESVVGGEKVGRFSFLGSDPFLRFEATGHEVTIRGTEETRRTSENPFEDLRQLLDSHRSIHLPGLPRFCGGAVGFAGYDAVRYTERLPNSPPDDRGLPDLAFNFFDRMVIFDHIRKTILVVAHARVTDRPLDDYETACRRIDEVVSLLGRPGRPLEPVDIATDGATTLAATSNMTRAEYEQVVRHCQEYIKAGDIFQVVPGQRFRVETSADPLHLSGLAGGEPEPVPVLSDLRE